MLLHIRHATVYRYTAPVQYSIQQLRLSPRTEPHQHTLSWRMHAPGRLQRSVDAHGNVTHTLVLVRSHGEVRLEVEGTVDVEPVRDGILPVAAGVTLSPLVYTVPTELTAADDGIRALCAPHLGPGRRADLLGLAGAVCDAVQYQGGYTEVTSTASQALALGRGVCQDHAHLFIACCRAAGIPARYVSGYVHPGSAPGAAAASHAWVDAWLDGPGWVSVDITHRRHAGDQHCRLAIGRDYLSAAPVRGMRSGGGEESLDVNVLVGTEQ